MQKSEFEGRFTNSPITPDILAKLGVFKPDALSGLRFNGITDKDGAKFLIWTTDGYVKNKNIVLGTLSIRQESSATNKPHLTIEQIYYNAEQLQHRIAVSMQCRMNPVMTPLSWTLSSRFIGGKDEATNDQIALAETGVVEDGQVMVTMGNNIFKRAISNDFTTDWGMFAAVCRLPFEKSVQHEFDLLEGLRRFRKNHKIVYKGKTGLHHYQQSGEGTLPYDYWLNDDHQLLMVITGNRAYIAEELIAESEIMNNSDKELE